MKKFCQPWETSAWAEMLKLMLEEKHAVQHGICLPPEENRRKQESIWPVAGPSKRILPATQQSGLKCAKPKGSSYI